MKPDFALSLSFEGIALLRRAPKGWSVVGDVSLEDGDLGANLAALRQQADALSTRGGQVKLVVPNDQIRYLSIPDTGLKGDALADSVRAALDGTTPLDVSDLVFDWSVTDGAVKIAAVARETLTEAEVFAAGHHFDPVCHVASAPADAFAGEVFFGASSGWTGPEPERDTEAVRIHYTNHAVLDETAEADSPLPVSATPPPITEPAPAPVPKATEVTPELAEPKTDTSAPLAFSSTRTANAPKPAPLVIKDLAGRAPPVGTAQPPAPTNKAPLAFKSKPPAARVSDPTIPADDAEPEAPVRKSGLGFLTRRKRAEDAANAASTQTQPKTQTLKPVAQPAATSARQSAATEPPKRVVTSALMASRAADGEVAVAAGTVVSEQQRMTVFGARNGQQIGGKPRFLGLMLTAALLVFLLGVAAWARVFFDEGFAALFPDKTGSETAMVLSDEPVEPVIQPEVISPAQEEAQQPTENVELAALVIEEQPVQPVPEAFTPPLRPEVLTADQVEATYAATGIWQQAPMPPALPGLTELGAFQTTGLDPVTATFDAVAMASARDLATDVALEPQKVPFGPGITFRFDERGLVLATPEGAVTPDGHRVFSGRPIIVPPPRPVEAALLREDPALLAERARLRAARPQARPNTLVEDTERVQLNGVSFSELALVRPVARTLSAKQESEDAATNATDLAVDQSIKPVPRPREFASIVQQSERAPATTQVAAVAPRIVQPDIPSSANVAREATVRNAINLNRINLIGVFGKPQNRSALVRMPNGRTVEVQVGDRLDGGQVAAIGDDALRYTKGGRSVTIGLP